MFVNAFVYSSRSAREDAKDGKLECDSGSGQRSHKKEGKDLPRVDQEKGKEKNSVTTL